jgi:phosphatidate phosphatase APP1
MHLVARTYLNCVCLFLRVTDLGEATFVYLGNSPW